MVSILRNGEMFRQREILLENGAGTWCCNREIPVGSYDLRLEADGFVTESKRGIRVLNGQDTEVRFVVRAGKGLHTVEYATGGLAREEVAARLAALDTAVAKLGSAVAKLQAANAAKPASP
jgi:hypothetical protein